MYASIMTVPARVTERGLHTTLTYIHANKASYYRKLVVLATAAAAAAAAAATTKRHGDRQKTAALLAASFFTGFASQAVLDKAMPTDRKKMHEKTKRSSLAELTPPELRAAWLKRYPQTLEFLLTSKDGEPRSFEEVKELARECPALIRR
jgi:hypothetical protein